MVKKYTEKNYTVGIAKGQKFIRIDSNYLTGGGRMAGTDTIYDFLMDVCSKEPLFKDAMFPLSIMTPENMDEFFELYVKEATEETVFMLKNNPHGVMEKIIRMTDMKKLKN